MSSILSLNLVKQRQNAEEKVDGKQNRNDRHCDVRLAKDVNLCKVKEYTEAHENEKEYHETMVTLQ